MSFFDFNAQDIVLDDDGDLLIENGDFAVFKSDGTHIRHIVESARGNWRFSPLLGVDIVGFTNAVGTLASIRMRRIIKSQLEQDGYRVDDVKIQNTENINIKANRIK